MIDDKITQEIIQKLLLFFVWGGGEGDKLSVLKQAVYRRTKFRNTHRLEKSLTTLDDKP